MARLIPEIVVGADLFVPAAGDYFSIESGGLPNGDDCLIVHGDVSADHWAFCKAPVLSPNMMLTRSMDWSLTYWTKRSALGTASRKVFGVCNYAGRNSAPSGGDANIPLEVRNNQFRYGVAGTNGFNSITPTADGNWHLMTHEVVLAGTGIHQCQSFMDLQSTATTGGGSTNGGSGSAAGTPYFFLGSYMGANMGMTVEYRIAKIAFHDHPLNLSERTLLYNAMMNP